MSANAHNRPPLPSGELARIADHETVNEILKDLSRKTKLTIADPGAGTPLTSPEGADITIALYVPESVAKLRGLLGFIRIEEPLESGNKNLNIYYPTATWKEGDVMEKFGAIIDEHDAVIALTSFPTVNEQTISNGATSDMEVGAPAGLGLGPNGYPLVSEFEAQELLNRIRASEPA